MLIRQAEKEIRIQYPTFDNQDAWGLGIWTGSFIAMALIASGLLPARLPFISFSHPPSPLFLSPFLFPVVMCSFLFFSQLLPRLQHTSKGYCRCGSPLF